MNQMPKNSFNEKLIFDFETTLNDFKRYFSSLMKTEEDINNYFLSFPYFIDISQSEANIAIKEVDSYLQDKKGFIIKNLQEKLNIIVKNYSSTVLGEFFDIIVTSWIQKNKEKPNVFFLSLEQTYNVFYLYGFRIIQRDTIDKLTGALQWDIISPIWLKYNFLLDYFKNLSLKIPIDLKSKTWTLVELTRIKKKEYERKLSDYQNYFKI